MLGRSTMLLLAALLLTACAGGDEGSATGPGGGVTTSADVAEPVEPTEPDDAAAQPTEEAEATLRVELRNVGAKEGAGVPVPSGIACTRSLPATCRETIECPVAGDGDPEGRRVCAWLRGDGRELLLEEPPVDQVCTEVYGGPEIATISGTLDGQPVDATFSREDGCAIARYDAVQPLWTGDFESTPAGAPGGPVTTEPRVVEDPPEAFQLDGER